MKNKHCSSNTQSLLPRLKFTESQFIPIHLVCTKYPCLSPKASLSPTCHCLVGVLNWNFLWEKKTYLTLGSESETLIFQLKRNAWPDIFFLFELLTFNTWTTTSPTSAKNSKCLLAFFNKRWQCTIKRGSLFSFQISNTYV